MSGRRGVSLIELLVVMSISGVLLGTASTMVCMLLSVHKSVRSHVQDSASRSRLAEQFRLDVHAATAIVRLEPGGAGPPAPGWVFRLDGQETLRYVVEPRGIVRCEYRGDKIVGRDVFLFSDDTTAAIEVDSEDLPTVVRLRIESAGGASSDCAGPSPARTISFETVLGRDHRFRENLGKGLPTARNNAFPRGART